MHAKSMEKSQPHTEARTERSIEAVNSIAHRECKRAKAVEKHIKTEYQHLSQSLFPMLTSFSLVGLVRFGSIRYVW